jgi:hypothetical protein
LREFRTSIPILATAARENPDDDDATVVAAKQARLQRIVESYFNTLLDQAKSPNEVAAETFALSDEIRGHAVGDAFATDLVKQIEASLGALNNLLSLPPDTQRATRADSRARTPRRFSARAMTLRRSQ